jgi:hypothetical protein
MTEAVIASKFKVNFIDLIRPRAPYGYDLEKAIAVYQWMVKTAQNPKYGPDDGWRGSYAVALLNRNVGARRVCEVDPFSRNWEEELWGAFRYALLDDCTSGQVEQWRVDHGISINQSRVISAPYYAGKLPMIDWGSPGRYSGLKGMINRLFTLEGRRLKDSHNSSHLQARTIVRVLWQTMPQHSLILKYGYGDEWSSSWEISIRSQEGELLPDWLYRAWHEANALVTEEDREPAPPKRYAWKRLSDGYIARELVSASKEALFERSGFDALEVDKPIKGFIAVEIDDRFQEIPAPTGQPS